MKVARRYYESSRRSLLVGGLLIAVAAGCSSSGDDGEEAEASTPSLASSTTTPAAATADTATTEPTTTATQVAKTLDLGALPGRIAFVAFGCDDEGFPSLSREDLMSMTPDDLMAMIPDEFVSMDPRICLMDPDGGNVQEIVVPDAELSWIAWTWDQKHLLFDGSDRSWMVDADGTGLVERDPYVPPVWGQSPDGTLRVSERRYENGFWVRPSNATRENPQWRQVTLNGDDCCDTAGWSPDSSKIVYTVGRDPQACAQVWIADVADGTTRQVTGPGTPNESQPTCPEWGGARFSPDGSLVLFIDEGPDFMVGRPMLVAPDGSGLRPLIANPSELPSGSVVTDAVWSPDGSAVLVSLNHDLGSQMFMVSVDGETMVELPNVPIALLSAVEMAWAPGA